MSSFENLKLRTSNSPPFRLSDPSRTQNPELRTQNFFTRPAFLASLAPPSSPSPCYGGGKGGGQANPICEPFFGHPAPFYFVTYCREMDQTVQLLRT